MPRSILHHHSSFYGQRPRNERRICFVPLDWQEEEKKAYRGQNMRQQQKKRMHEDRQIRHQDHVMRRQAFEVFTSNDYATRKLVEDLLEEDARTSDQLYSRALYAMLQSLGAPSWHLVSMLEWLRCSGFYYSKHLCRDCEFLDSYLLFLGRAEVFQKRFVRKSTLNPPDWTNPFITGIQVISDFSCDNTTVNNDMLFTHARQTKEQPGNNFGSETPKEGSLDVPWSGASSSSFVPKLRKRASIRLLRRALKYLFLTLTRRRATSVGDLMVGSVAVAESLGCASWSSLDTKYAHVDVLKEWNEESDGALEHQGPFKMNSHLLVQGIYA